MQSSHQKKIRFDCKVSRLLEVFGRDGMGIIAIPRLHHPKDPQTLSQSERHMVMLFFYF